MNRSRITGDLVSQNNIFVDIANDRVGIGSTIPGTKLQLPDSEVISLGNAGDLQLVHTPSLSSISSGGVNNFTIRQSAGSGFLFIHGDQLHLRSQSTNEPYFVGTNNGTVQLYYDGSVALNTAAIGIVVTGTTDTDGLVVSGVTTAGTINTTFINSTGNIEIDVDNGEFRCGAGGDFKISHTGSENILRSDFPTFFRNAANNETLAKFTPNGAVELYHNNTKRFETTNTGVNLTNHSYSIISGAMGSTENIKISNTTSGGYIQIGMQQQDSDGLHHRGYIKASKGGAGIAGKLELLARGSGGGTNRGWIIDAAVGIQANQQVLPETDSTYDLGSNTKRWSNLYADTLYGDGSNLTGVTQTTINSNADNRIITGSGTANTLNAESGLTFSDRLTIDTNINQKILLKGATHPYVHFYESSTAKAYVQWHADGLSLIHI